MGSPFDPNLHDAIMREPSSEVPDGTVLEEFRKVCVWGGWGGGWRGGGEPPPQPCLLPPEGRCIGHLLPACCLEPHCMLFYYVSKLLLQVR